ncbi:MAG: glutamine-hydrolyzing GMP synthase [Desulfobacterales bacterium]|nr:glutamine-hydrolyzing GMP synthase [Desulfobacterales bacterium]
MILIIDFGSQYNLLIARRVREHKVFCHIEPPTVSIDHIRELKPKGIILSGGPASIYDDMSPKIDPQIFELNIPVLGICYGMQYMVHALGGHVKKAQKREYGFAQLAISNSRHFFEGIELNTTVWMSHGDTIDQLPNHFQITASTVNTTAAAISHIEKSIYGVQFHPEVDHTPLGKHMLENFIFQICQCEQSWTMNIFIQQSIEQIQHTVGDKHVILGLSGGIDSTVTAVLLHRALGAQLTCIFIDNGLLRQNEGSQLQKTFSEHLKLTIRYKDASEEFLQELHGITDPEQKRKIIGKKFIEVFEQEAETIRDADFLAQGTLYPDIIESISAFGGPSSTIKSHHNVGGLPQHMKLKLIEPLKYLFKDEVRILGKELGLPDDLVWRQPFPGPGLAIRIIGEITHKRLDVLRKADKLLIEEIKKNGLYQSLWQSFAVLLPIKSVGVMGDQRTYESTIVIRAVTSKDAMTADWARLPHELLATISNRIINEVQGINRVVYDISSKPPATIEWE